MSSTDEWIKKMWLWNIMQPSKKRNLAICNDVDGTRGYYAKRKKSVRKRQIPYDFTHVWNLRNR